jgi:hypothetical protein
MSEESTQIPRDYQAYSTYTRIKSSFVLNYSPIAR